MIENKYYDMTDEQFESFKRLYKECDPGELLLLLADLWEDEEQYSPASRDMYYTKRADKKVAALLRAVHDVSSELSQHVP